ncbi:MAG TPA: iron-sulfur cluster assembly scaffold protein [Chthoniobacteraceae bacterium]|jgi:NifU-like protein involved in Fe-S cluster formation|nr:iron-sulfur cluster assembly scaffold protein [Chthoniobacteraceae bacterium]
MSENLEQRIHDAIAHPRNLGEMEDADSVGTVGSADCGDMLRMWVKFKEDAQGRKVIDRATFQTFGCETALAVASVATELIAGKTVEEALSMSGADLSAPLGALPPMKIHCAQLVERALQSALSPTPPKAAPAAAPAGSTLVDSLAPQPARKVKLLPKTGAPTAAQP